MNPRDRVLAILDRKPVDRIPVDIWCTPEVLQSLKTHFQSSEELETYRALGVDKIVWVFPEYKAVPENMSMWGTEIRKVDTGIAVYEEFTNPGLAGRDTIESLEDYPCWPDPDEFDYQAAKKLAKKASGDFVTIGPWVSFYEVYCVMRGMEQAMIDLVTNPDYVNALLDRIEKCQTEMMKRFFDIAGNYIDLVFVSDDMGSQQNLLISRQMWDKYFKERMRRWCDFIHSYGMKVFYHSDGAVGDLIDQLIDSGIDILNPIQHECPGMGMPELKSKYGDKLIFHGGVENQSALPFGSVEDVKNETLECLNTLGKGREGYICCSCHNVQPSTPLENIFAMVDTVKSKGAI